MKMRIVMPAIYEPDVREIGGQKVDFGWYDLDELVKAVDDVFRKFGWPGLGLRLHFLLNFWLLLRDKELLWIGNFGLLHTATNANDFELRTAHHVFVPAGWGKAVIDATKRGVYHVYQRGGDTGVIYGKRYDNDDEIKVGDLIRPRRSRYAPPIKRK